MSTNAGCKITRISTFSRPEETMLHPGPDRPVRSEATDPPSVSKAELLQALGGLVRGLSAIFWGLPLALLVCVKTATREGPETFGVAPPVLATALLCYGLWQLGGFQPHERIGSRALDRAKLLALTNLGLAPFTYWWGRIPGEPIYYVSFGLLIISAVLFLACLNQLLHRLTAMLPDETLRTETNLFTTLNLNLLIGLVVLMLSYLVLRRVESLPPTVRAAVEITLMLRYWILVVLISVPLAITMAMVWKIKEVLLASVLEAGTTS